MNALPSKSFAKHVLIMMTGTAVAQIIPFALAPILSRLYSPEQFGIMGGVVAAAALLAILLTGRFELAIVLPRSERDAGALVLGTLVMATGGTVLLSGVLIFAGQELQTWPQFKTMGPWLYVVPWFGLLMAAGQVGSNLANRERGYRRMALAGVIQQLASGFMSVGAGLLRLPMNGLVAGRVTGGFVYALFFLPLVRQILPCRTRRADVWAHVRLQFRQYRQFPTFNLPYSFIGSFSREFIIFAFNAVHALGPAGYYALVRTMLTAPVTFLSTSLSQVFYKEAAERIGTAEFSALTFRLLIGMACILAPAFALLSCWGGDIFAVIFGERWRIAGEYARLLALPSLLSVFTSWPERVFEVRNRQHWALGIQVTFDAIAIATVWGVLALGKDPYVAIAAYAGIQCGYHAVYLATVFRLMPIPLSKLLHLGTIVVLAFAGVWAMHLILPQAIVLSTVRFIIETIFVTAASLTALTKLKRR